MTDRSKMSTHDGIEVRVYEGFLTKLITNNLNLSTPLYTTIMQELKRMDCVRQLKRGGGGGTSIWALLQTPTLELFTKAQARPVPGSSSRMSQDQIRQALNSINNRLNRIEAHLGLH